MVYESTLLKSVQLLTPDGVREGDIYIENGKISAIDWSLSRDADLVIKDTGLTALPGVIDPHVHFRDPGATWKEDLASGSRAAASGGVTSFFDMPNTTPTTTSCEAMAAKKKIAAEKSLINYNFFMGATAENLEDLLAIENVPGIKIYMGPSTGSLVLEDLDIIETIIKSTRHCIAFHAEDGAILKRNEAKYSGSTSVHDHLNIRTEEAAITATSFICRLANQYKHHCHICHVSSAAEADLLTQEMASPYITSEATPQHLLLNAPECYDQLGTFAQINPPLRTKRHAEAVFKALKAGAIQCVVTDHAPHTREEKEKPFGQAPSGMPMIEHSLSLMLTLVAEGKASLEEVSRWMSTHPAKVYGIKNKGSLAPGYDADIVLVDLAAKQTIHNDKIYSKAGWSAFHGKTVTGIPLMTFVNGHLAFREGDFFDEQLGTEIQIDSMV